MQTVWVLGVYGFKMISFHEHMYSHGSFFIKTLIIKKIILENGEKIHIEQQKQVQICMNGPFKLCTTILNR